MFTLSFCLFVSLCSPECPGTFLEYDSQNVCFLEKIVLTFKLLLLVHKLYVEEVRSTILTLMYRDQIVHKVGKVLWMHSVLFYLTDSK